MKWDAKTITAVGAVVVALFGGAELRAAVWRLEGKIERMEERVVRIERHFDTYAQND